MLPLKIWSMFPDIVLWRNPWNITSCPWYKGEKEDATPVIVPPRKIEEPTEWVSGMVVVEKPNGDLRPQTTQQSDQTTASQNAYYRWSPRGNGGCKVLHECRRKSRLLVNSSLDVCDTLGKIYIPEITFWYTFCEWSVSSWGCQHHCRSQRIHEPEDDIIIWGRTIEEHDENLEKSDGSHLGLGVSGDF